MVELRGIELGAPTQSRANQVSGTRLYNAYHDVVNFTLPTVSEGLGWLSLIDTNQPDQRPAAFPIWFHV